MMRSQTIAMIVALLLPALATAQVVVEVLVPGHADPWLAGMPDGSTASCCLGHCDKAPAQSPQLVPGLCLYEGNALTFQVTGGTAQDPTFPLLPPDGGYPTIHNAYDENGIAALTAPFSCSVGVFLADAQPDQTPAPPGLDFSTPESRDYLVLLPELKQVFFIGDGVTAAGTTQHVLIPAGATRLYLGTMDSCEWLNNIGKFDAIVTDPCASVAVEAVTWSTVKARYR